MQCFFYQLAYGQAQGSAYRRLQGIGGHVDDGSCAHEEDRFVYIVQQGDQQTGASCQQQPGQVFPFLRTSMAHKAVSPLMIRVAGAYMA